MEEEKGYASRRLQHPIRGISLRLQVRLHAHQLQHPNVDAGDCVQAITFRRKFEKAASTRKWLRAAIFRPGHPDGQQLPTLHDEKPRFFLESDPLITMLHRLLEGRLREPTCFMLASRKFGRRISPNTD